MELLEIFQRNISNYCISSGGTINLTIKLRIVNDDSYGFN